VTGEEGIILEDFVTYQKSLFLDMVYLQQDVLRSQHAIWRPCDHCSGSQPDSVLRSPGRTPRAAGR
jgi:hypothetical protein